MMKTFNKSNKNLQGLSMALLMLFSMGQALAFFKSCEMNSSDHSTHQTQQAENINTDLDTNHDSMSESSMSESQSMNDCCDDHCICPQGSCSSISLISVIPSTQFLDIDSHSGLASANSLSLNKISNSLYRPPIAC